jgi:hypothetical protein
VERQRQLLPFRLQYAALTTDDDSELQFLLSHLESLAGEDGKQLRDCATWAATVAYRVQANARRSPNEAAASREVFRNEAMRLLERAADDGELVQLDVLKSLIHYNFDLEILIGHPRLSQVAVGAVRQYVPLRWHVDYYSWRDSGPEQPPDNWAKVISSSPVESGELETMNLQWGVDAPGKAVPADHFAVIATSEFASEDGDYLFEFGSDDGIRVYLDDQLILEHWDWRTFATDIRRIRLAKGNHRLKVEYFEITGVASLVGRVSRGFRSIPARPVGASASNLDLTYLRDDGDLVIVNAGNGAATIVPREAAQWKSVEWIHNGSQLAMRQGQRIVAVDPLKPADRRTLVEFEDEPTQSSVSPTGDLVAVEERVNSNSFPRVRVINITNRFEREVRTQAFDPLWSADGTKLALLEGASDGWRIALFDTAALALGDASAQKSAAPTAQMRADSQLYTSGNVFPALSPDGRTIAFAMNAKDGTRQIGLLTVADQSVRQVTNNARYNLMPAFSPDGRFIAYLRGTAVPYELAVFDLQENTEIVVTSDAAQARPCWRVHPSAN